MDKDREEELKIAEVLMQGAIALSLLAFTIWSIVFIRSPATTTAAFWVMIAILVLIFYGFYLALFGEKRRKYLALIGEKKDRKSVV